MRRYAFVPLLAVLLFGSVGCMVRHVDDMRFRTLQRQTAFDRAIAAVEQHCNGAYKADRETGVIISNWIDPNFGMGIPPRYLWYRYRVTVVGNPADDSADVRISMQAVSCSLFDSRNPDKMASDCSPPEHIPSEVRESYERIKVAFQQDVFRRDG